MRRFTLHNHRTDEKMVVTAPNPPYPGHLWIANIVGRSDRAYHITPPQRVLRSDNRFHIIDKQGVRLTLMETTWNP